MSILNLQENCYIEEKEMNEDYYFIVRWRDADQKLHNVAIMARINNIYYLKKNKNSIKAYQNGYNGIPSFSKDILYKNESEMFDFFNMRILNEDKQEDPCKLLSKSLGKRPVDSFSLEIIEGEDKKEAIKKMILQLDKVQEENKKVH